MLTSTLRVEILNAEPDLALLVDQQGICHEYFTQDALQSTNAISTSHSTSPRDQAVGQSIEDLLPAPLAVQLSSALAEMDQAVYVFEYTGQSIRAQHDDRCADCAPRHCRYVVRLTFCGAERFLCIFRDVTLEARTTQSKYLEAQKMEALGRLAGGIAHDFNNILTVITGYSELILSLTPEANPLRSNLEQLHGAGQRAAHLTQQLLAFSGKQVIMREVLNLSDFVRSQEGKLLCLMGVEIELSCELASDLHLIEVAPALLEQVLINLTRNACEAMPHGGQLLIQTQNVFLRGDESHIHAHRCAGHYVRFTIRDTGQGMDEATQNQMFEPFLRPLQKGNNRHKNTETTKGYRREFLGILCFCGHFRLFAVDSFFTTKPMSHGTGHGLSTVYGIMMQTHGSIDVESKKGVGAAIHTFFPSSDKPRLNASVQFQSTVDPSQTTIFVVEDEEPIRALMVMILEEEGYTVLQASNGFDALELAMAYERSIDLLLTDIIMPGMNGYDLYNQISQQRTDLKTLFVSGYSNSELIPETFSSSTVAFLNKPFTVQELLQKVQSVFSDQNF